MKVDEIRALNDEDLVKQFDESRKELFDLRFKLATKQLVKKDIACLKTIIRERELKIR